VGVYRWAGGPFSRRTLRDFLGEFRLVWVPGREPRLVAAFQHWPRAVAKELAVLVRWELRCHWDEMGCQSQRLCGLNYKSVGGSPGREVRPGKVRADKAISLLTLSCGLPRVAVAVSVQMSRRLSICITGQVSLLHRFFQSSLNLGKAGRRE
jgi:hypothetical protein